MRVQSRLFRIFAELAKALDHLTVLGWVFPLDVPELLARRSGVSDLVGQLLLVVIFWEFRKVDRDCFTTAHLGQARLYHRLDCRVLV